MYLIFFVLVIVINDWLNVPKFETEEVKNVAGKENILVKNSLSLSSVKILKVPLVSL